MMKPIPRRWLPVCFGLLTAAAALCLRPTPVEAQAAPVLDHFKCYSASGQELVPEPVVLLRDQFGPPAGVAEDFLVRRPVLFCNPAEKTTAAGVITPIIHPEAHLKLYVMAPSLLEPTRRVAVRNQFGRQLLRVFSPEVLAVPTGKNAPPPPPEDLDHFKCYRVWGAGVNQAVLLRDQFHDIPELVTVGRPLLLCNPVEKTHKEVVTPPLHPEAHLVCYLTTRTEFSGVVITENQFGVEDLLLGASDVLCVPSAKQRLR